MKFIDKITSMNMNDITDKDLNVLGSYWGILSHADCRHLWYKYTRTKSFAEFKHIYHPECSARDVLTKTIKVYNTKVVFNKRNTKLYIKAKYNDRFIFIHTTCRMLIDIVLNMPEHKTPWETAIVKDKSSYYIFTQT